jgi:uncharacterized protein (DUF1015 family)
MTEVVPFRGIHYNHDKVSGEVVAPPYDVISPEMRDSLYAQSPYNIVRIDFGMKNPGDSEEDNRYTRARAFLEAWIEKDILLRSDRPCYYAYRMTFDTRSGRKGLTGLYGLTRIVELGKGVYPHEATHSKPKKDRLSLMAESRANTSPIYSLYKSKKSGILKDILTETASATPYIESTDADGTLHSFWIIDSPNHVKAMQEALRQVDVFIADGHHRYETAIEYKRSQDNGGGGTGGPAPHDYVLMFLVDMDDPELIALPTHRLVTVDTDTIVERLSKNFEITEIGDGADILAAIEEREHAFGMYAGGRRYTLSCRVCKLEDVPPELKSLDVVVLHKLIFGKLLEVGNWGYEMDYETTLSMVDDGEYDAAFFLNPAAVSDVELVPLAGLRMHPKSTYFYPKVRTGFVINTLTSL